MKSIKEETSGCAHVLHTYSIAKSKWNLFYSKETVFLSMTNFAGFFDVFFGKYERVPTLDLFIRIHFGIVIELLLKKKILK